jgi:hypothetical protein
VTFGTFSGDQRRARSVHRILASHQENIMELKLFDRASTSEHCGDDDADGFMLELTLEQLAFIGGGRADESPKE